jgi:glycosyltransferase involved in cell wall biosynthesis
MGVLPRKLDEQIVKHFDKPRVVQWYGSEIRDPELECRINPFYAEALGNEYEYGHESSEFSHSTQEKFARLGFYPVEFPEMTHYVKSDLFPFRFATRQMVNLEDHLVSLPNSSKKRPVVVHSPSAPVAKGTKFVLEAVESLKRTFDFEFVLVEKMAREEALEIMRGCDIFVDQLILGSHGYAAVEAMAFGKPVVCHINPQTLKAYPKDLPIVNANPKNIAGVLGALLKDGALRLEVGRRGRKYVEKYHDGRKVTADLIETYNTVIRIHKDRQLTNG